MIIYREGMSFYRAEPEQPPRLGCSGDPMGAHAWAWDPNALTCGAAWCCASCGTIYCVSQWTITQDWIRRDYPLPDDPTQREPGR